MIWILVVTLTGCQSQSGHLNDQPIEKIVIIDSYTPTEGIYLDGVGRMYKYKVKRISYGVIDVIYEHNQYEAGDTIYHRFKDHGDIPRTINK